MSQDLTFITNEKGQKLKVKERLEFNVGDEI